MTFLFDAMFGESNKIYLNQFESLLYKIPEISSSEREYLKSVFADDLRNGLTMYELKKRIEQLSRNQEDSIDDNELRKVKEKLLGALGD